MYIKTDFPNAYKSPDYINPAGAKEDNYSNILFLNELKRMAFEHVMVFNKKFSYLDFGCAGGQAVVELYKIGHLSCGIEGSNLDIMLNPEISKNNVNYNWATYKDKCLFKADFTKPFELYNKKNEIEKFDILAAWDVLEHLLPKDIPNIIQNIKKHMHKNSIFIAIISTTNTEGDINYHQCVKDREWWIDIFSKYNMYDIGFTMVASPRQGPPYAAFNETDVAFIFKNKKT